MDTISYKDFTELITANKSAFLCGNGFSINFDKRFQWNTLMEQLYLTHKSLEQCCEFNVSGKALIDSAVKPNFENVMREINRLNTKEKFESIFESAVLFAHSIIDNPKALKWFDSNVNQRLEFGLKISDLVEMIVKQADLAISKTSIAVNYEYWTILIYCVIAMKNAPKDVHTLDKSNAFVRLVLIGGELTLSKNNIHKNFNIKGDANQDTIINGMYTYFRFLFSGNILLQGDAVNVENLENWKTLDLDRVRSFINKFDYLMTTNYDYILEGLTSRNVSHLHGYYSKVPKRVLDMSLGMRCGLTRYDLSTIVIGDYFVSKTIYQISARMSTYNSLNNSKIQIYDEMIKEIVEEKQINTVVIFGLNVDNDYHIIRSLQVHLSKTENPHIIYCYFTPQDKQAFLDIYYKCITYSDEVNNAVKNIRVSFVDSHNIINNIFNH